ncbi:MAG: DUF835 domain-containing protein [Thermoplasmata archaeon]|nr:DUF835 domain-containing protein [Thermoplasmata archaeon]
MIVEDQREMEEFYKDLFAAMGFDIVAVARDGQTAVQKYKELDPKPDLVIMDHRLPGMSGLQASQEILEYDPKAPVVIITADEEGLWEAAMRGVPAIKKPAVFEKIIKAVMRSVPGVLTAGDKGEEVSDLQRIFSPQQMYLIPEEEPEWGMRAFLDLVYHGYRGILFTRKNPDELKKEYPLEGIPIVWFSTLPSDKYETVTPLRVQHLLLLLQESFRSEEPTVAYLEGFEFFITNIPFDRILNMIQVLRDRVMRSEKLTLIMSLDPEILDPRQYKILQKEFIIIPPDKIKEVFQSKGE